MSTRLLLALAGVCAVSGATAPRRQLRECACTDLLDGATPSTLNICFKTQGSAVECRPRTSALCPSDMTACTHSSAVPRPRPSPPPPSPPPPLAPCSTWRSDTTLYASCDATNCCPGYMLAGIAADMMQCVESNTVRPEVYSSMCGTPSPAAPPSPVSCEDIKSARKCGRKRAKGRCTRGKVRRKCRNTCEAC